MSDDRLRGIRILGWIIAALAIHNLIVYIVGLYYFGARVGYVPKSFESYLNIFLYFPHIHLGHELYNLFEKSTAVFLDSFIQQKFPFVYKILFLISAIGILNFKNWARKLMIVCSLFLFLLMCTSFYYKFQEINTFGKILHLFKTLILLYPIIYLTRPKVREQFLEKPETGAK